MSSQNKIGIIQGRLSPPLNGKIQSFPINVWEKEFPIANECGFDGIELVIDSDNWIENPLYTQEGTDKILQISEKTGLEIFSVDPLYLTERGLMSNDPIICSERLEFMKNIIPNCYQLGMKYIIMPIIINPDLGVTEKLKSKTNMIYLKEFLKHCLDITIKYDVGLALETALNGEEILELIDELDSTSIYVCYDTGNSSYFGHNIESDLNLLSDLLVEVHIKDHSATDENGHQINYYNSVELGTGDVDFNLVFNTLSKINFSGNYILQMARGEDHIGVAKSSLNFVKTFQKNISLIN
tara:strand:- start:161 stop:1051 length:891 start_codon:yes stop_codon:yes gene_type:complete